MIITRENLCTAGNLYLAWKRIQTSTRPEYKELCNEQYTAFSWHVDRKIDLFASELKDKIYQPIHSSRFYQPKVNGLVRPISILSIKDQIFYQAVINLICQERLSEINLFRRGTVFGGFNIREPSSIYFLSRWQDEYKNYKKIIEKNFNSGYEWICKFDLASFYDTIDHNILIETACLGLLDDDVKHLFLQALNTWSQPQSVQLPYSQGIPQGPCASQVLADLYLNYLDRKMKSLAIHRGLKYIRYVDDIVLMGKKENEVKVGLIKLDIIARELALVPQSGKIEIKRIENIEDEVKGENSLIDLISESADLRTNKSQEYLKLLFLQSITEDDGVEVVDETGFKFSLYRLNPDLELVETVLKVVEHYFHLVSICIIYLNRFEYIREVDDHISRLIVEDPVHDWYAAQLLKCNHVYRGKNLDDIHRNSLKTIMSSDKHWFLKRKCIDVLEDYPDKDFILIELFHKQLTNPELLESQLPYHMTSLVSFYKLDPSMLRVLLSDKEENAKYVFDEFYLLYGYMHQQEGGSCINNVVSNWFASSFLDYEERENFHNKDGVYYYLMSFYKVSKEHENVVNFKSLLGNEYNLALNHLYKAIGFYSSRPEDYILQTDIFHQVLVSSILRREGSNISRYDMGNMLGKLQNILNGRCSAFQRCHELRGDSDRVHAYNKTRQAENERSASWWFREAKSLKEELSISYKYLMAYLSESP